MKEQDKSPEKEQSTMEISNLSDKEFKVVVIKILTKLKRKVDKTSDNLDRKYKKNHPKLKNTVTKVKLH